MGISTFGGGNPALGSGSGSGSSTPASTVDPMVIGQVIQAAGGLNLLPADGRILKKADYPIAYAALQNDQMEVSTLPANLQYQNMAVANAGAGAAPGAYLAATETMVLLAASATVNVSTDKGKSWQNYPLPLASDGSTPTWVGVAASDSKFCAISNKCSATSTDGINWTVGPLFTAYNPVASLSSFNWTGNDFLYTGAHGINGVNTSVGFMSMSSVDGLNWDNRGAVPIGRIQRILRLANGTYFAYGLTTNTAAATNVVATSTDGINWTQRTLPNADTFLGAAVAGNTIAMVSSTKSYVSTDSGVTWTVTAFSGTFTGITSVSTFAGTDNNFLMAAVTTGSFTAGIFTSADGITWTALSGSNVAAQISNSIIATDNAGTLVYPAGTCVMVSKDDGLTWNGYIPAVVNAPNWNSAIWTGSFFLVSCHTQTTAYKSTDGINWTVATTTMPVLPGAANIYHYSPTFNLHYLTTGSAATTAILTSPDGITWTSRAMTASYTVYGINTFAGKITVSVSNVMSQISTNGTTFAAATVTSMQTGLQAASPTVMVKFSLPTTAAHSAAYAAVVTTDGTNWSAKNVVPLPVGVTSYSPSGLIWTGTQFILYCVKENFGWSSPDGTTWTLIPTLFDAIPNAAGVGYAAIADVQTRPIQYGTSGFAVVIRSAAGAGNVAEMFLAFSKDFSTPKLTLRQNSIGRGAGVGLVFSGRTQAGGGRELVALDGSTLIRYVDGATALELKGVYIPYSYGGSSSSWTVAKNPNGVYFALRNSNYSIRSTDGITWTASTVPGTLNQFHDLAVMGSKFYFVHAGGFASTDDGITFNSMNYPYSIHTSANGARRLSTDGTKLLMTYTPNAANSQSFTYFATYDGNATFTTRTPVLTASSAVASQIARKGSMLIMASMSDSALFTSMDGGATWTGRYLGNSNYNISSIIYSPKLDQFVMIHYGSATWGSQIAHTIVYTSVDGVRWTPRVLPSSQKWSWVVCCGNLVFALSGSNGATSNVWAYTKDGVNWTQITAPVLNDWNYPIATDRSFIATGYASGYALGLYGRLFDPATEFQLPYYTFTLGAPSWFMKVK